MFWLFYWIKPKEKRITGHLYLVWNKENTLRLTSDIPADRSSNNASRCHLGYCKQALTSLKMRPTISFHASWYFKIVTISKFKIYHPSSLIVEWYFPGSTLTVRVFRVSYFGNLKFEPYYFLYLLTDWADIKNPSRWYLFNKMFRLILPTS